MNPQIKAAAQLCARKAKEFGADPATQAVLMRKLDEHSTTSIEVLSREECYRVLGVDVPAAPKPGHLEIAISSGVTAIILEVPFEAFATANQ